MKTYLVTGGAGFIGSNFIHMLFKKESQDFHVINLDKLTYAGNLENLRGVDDRENYTIFKADICSRQEVESVFQSMDIDCVINFAAESHVDRSIVDPEVFLHTNVLGVQVLLNAALKSWQKSKGYPGNKMFIQISTDEVYGSLGAEGFFSEENILNPSSPYSASKAAADLLVNAAFQTYKMPVVITRCTNNYGPYQFPEKLIPLMIHNCLKGNPLPLYGDGKNVRDWIFVEDHCEAIHRVVLQGRIGGVYNIGGQNERENIEVVRSIINSLRKVLKDDPRKEHINEKLIKFVEDRKGHDRRYAVDCQKIKRELNWSPRVSFQEGILKTVTWYLDNQEWLNNAVSGEYRNYYRKMYGSTI